MALCRKTNIVTVYLMNYCYARGEIRLYKHPVQFLNESYKYDGKNIVAELFIDRTNFCLLVLISYRCFQSQLEVL